MLVTTTTIIISTKSNNSSCLSACIFIKLKGKCYFTGFIILISGTVLDTGHYKYQGLLVKE